MQRIGCLHTWLIAFIIPAPLVIYGVICIGERSAVFINFWDFGGGWRILGDKAIALGLAYLAIGAAMHFRFGWTNWPGLRIVALPMFVLSLLVLIGAIAYLALQLGPS